MKERLLLFLVGCGIFSGLRGAAPLPLDSLLAAYRTQINDTASVSTMVRIGRAYFYSQPDSSKYYYHQALQLAERWQYEFGSAYALLNLGDYYQARGKYPESLQHYLRSLSMLEAQGRESMVASCHNNISLVYMAIGAMDDAMAHSKLALDYYRRVNRMENVMNILNNMGLIHFGRDEFKEAEAAYRESLELRQKAGTYKGSVLHNLGELMAECGYNDSAMAYFQLSLAEKVAANRVTNMPTTYIQIGLQHRYAGDNQKAMEAFMTGYKIAKESNLEADRAELCKAIGDLMASEGRWQEAYQFEHEGRMLHDTIFNPDLVNAMAQSEVDYSLQKTEVERKELQLRKELAEAGLRNSRWLSGLALVALAVVSGLLLWIYRLNLKRGQINRDLNALNADLEERVRQRTASLQAKTEVLERHAFDLSHRVRGPVASILGLAALIDTENPANPTNAKYLEGIKAKTQSLDQVLHEINSGLE